FGVYLTLTNTNGCVFEDLVEFVKIDGEGISNIPSKRSTDSGENWL
ncbi:3270_t:CDS:2, partial [Gigaspora rosea]